jgi:hypothetical protein
VRSVVVVVRHILADGAEEVTLIENDEVIEQLAPKGSDEALGVAHPVGTRLAGGRVRDLRLPVDGGRCPASFDGASPRGQDEV